MRYLIVGLAVATAITLAVDGVALAQPKPGFKLGFKLLADQIPHIVGEPIEDEHYGTNGDSLQRTTTGLMVWRKVDNFTAFTNGHRTWVNGPGGVQERGNDERFEWEASLPTQAPTPTPVAERVLAEWSLPIDYGIVIGEVRREARRVQEESRLFGVVERVRFSEYITVLNVGTLPGVDLQLHEVIIDKPGVASEPPFRHGSSRSAQLLPGYQVTWLNEWSLTGFVFSGYLSRLDSTLLDAVLENKVFARGFVVTWQWQHSDGSLSPRVRSAAYFTHDSGRR